MRHILAAVDFSPVSDAVIARAAEIARGCGSELTLLHVAAPDPDFVGFGPGPETVRDSRAQEIVSERRELQQTAEELRTRGLEARALIFQGPTVEKVLEEARRIPADLLVVGSHGRGAVGRALLGSVSHAILRHPPCPILVVPPPSAQ